MHTVKVLAVGFVLLGLFILIGRWLGHGSPAALYFVPAWLIIAALNLWYGVTRAGYTIADELPIFLLIFAVPSAVAVLLWWRFRLA